MANKIKAHSTIGSVSKATESGYVNIGGVWKPVVEAYNNVGGVWKSAWEVGGIPVTITSAGVPNYNAYFKVGGVQYYKVGTYVFDIGTEIDVRSRTIKLNGETVAETPISSYTFVLTDEYTAVDIEFTGSMMMYTANITTR